MAQKCPFELLSFHLPTAVQFLKEQKIALKHHNSEIKPARLQGRLRRCEAVPALRPLREYKSWRQQLPVPLEKLLLESRQPPFQPGQGGHLSPPPLKRPVTVYKLSP